MQEAKIDNAEHSNQQHQYCGIVFKYLLYQCYDNCVLHWFHVLSGRDTLVPGGVPFRAELDRIPPPLNPSRTRWVHIYTLVSGTITDEEVLVVSDQAQGMSEVIPILNLSSAILVTIGYSLG